MRRRRLRVLLGVATTRSAWHARRLAGIALETISPDDLSSLPTMTKIDLLTNFDSIVTDPRLTRGRVEAHLTQLDSDRYLEGRYHALASGGSSRVRGIFVHDEDAFVYGQISMMRFAERASSGWPSEPDGRWVTTVVAGDPASHASAAGAATFDSEQRPLHSVPATLPIDDIAAALDVQQPNLLAGYPSVLARLARRAHSGDLTIRPRLVLSTAEPLTETLEATIRDAWSVPILNVWGMSESGAAAVTCLVGGGMHLSDDFTIIEPVDSAGRRVPDGAESDKVLVTNLMSVAQPLIRYEATTA